MSAKLILKRRSKYRNVRARVDGITFDSKREAARWLVLKAMEKAGEIIYLARPVKYLLAVNGVKITTSCAASNTWPPPAAILNIHRKAGKSFTVAMKGLHKALFTPNAEILIVCPSENQAQVVMR